MYDKSTEKEPIVPLMKPKTKPKSPSDETSVVGGSVSVPSERPATPEPPPMPVPEWPEGTLRAAKMIQEVLGLPKLTRAFRRSLVESKLRPFAELGPVRQQIEQAIAEQLKDRDRVCHWVTLARMLKPGAPPEHVARLMGVCIGYGVIGRMA